MHIEYFYSKRRKLDFLKIHCGQQIIYVDGFGVAMLDKKLKYDPHIEYIRTHAPPIMLAARKNIWGKKLESEKLKGVIKNG